MAQPPLHNRPARGTTQPPASTCGSRACNFALPKASGGERARQGKRRGRAGPVGCRTPQAGDPHKMRCQAGRAPHGSAAPGRGAAGDPSPRAATRERRKLKPCFKCSQKAKGIGHSPRHGEGWTGTGEREGTGGSGRRGREQPWPAAPQRPEPQGQGARRRVLTMKTPLDARVSWANNHGGQPRVPRSRGKGRTDGRTRSGCVPGGWGVSRELCLPAASRQNT